MWVVLNQKGGSLLVRDEAGNRLRLEAGKPVEVSDADGRRLMEAYGPVEATSDPEEVAVIVAEVEAKALVTDAQAEDAEQHEFVVSRDGVHCIICEREEPGHKGWKPPAIEEVPPPESGAPAAAPETPSKSGAISVGDLSEGATKGGKRKRRAST